VCEKFEILATNWGDITGRTEKKLTFMEVFRKILDINQALLTCISCVTKSFGIFDLYFFVDTFLNNLFNLNKILVILLPKENSLNIFKGF